MWLLDWFNNLILCRLLWSSQLWINNHILIIGCNIIMEQYKTQSRLEY